MIDFGKLLGFLLPLVIFYPSVLVLVVVKASAPVTYSRQGDITIGFVLPVHKANTTTLNVSNACGEMVPSRAVAVSQFVRIVDAVNEDASFLNGLRLGFEIVDSCSLPSVVLTQIAPWASNKITFLNHPLAFVVGNGQNDIAAPLAIWLQQFNIPYIDFNSTAAELGDRARYPLLARTVPSDKMKAQIIAAMVANVFEWRHVNLVFSRGIYGESGAAALRQELSKLGVSVAADFQAPVATSIGRRSVKQFAAIVNALDRSHDVPGVVCFCDEDDTVLLMRALRVAAYKTENLPRLILIASGSFKSDHRFAKNELAPDGLVSIVNDLPPTDTNKWFADNSGQVLRQQADNPFLLEFLREVIYSGPDSSGCSGNCTLAATYEVPDDMAFGSMTTAVFAGIYAIKSMLHDVCGSGASANKCRSGSQFTKALRNGTLLYNHLRQVSFEAPFITPTAAELPFTFDNNAEPQAKFKFVLFAEEETGEPISEEFGDYSYARKFINLACSELVASTLFTEQHVDCRRPDAQTQSSYTLSYTYASNNYANPMIIVSSISSAIFLTISMAVIVYHIYTTKQKTAHGSVIVLRSPRAAVGPTESNRGSLMVPRSEVRSIIATNSNNLPDYASITNV